MAGRNCRQSSFRSAGQGFDPNESEDGCPLPLPGQGLRALGVDETALATFPEEFRQGMVARAEVLGDTGRNHPDRWIGGLASPDAARHRHPVRAQSYRAAAGRPNIQAFFASTPRCRRAIIAGFGRLSHRSTMRTIISGIGTRLERRLKEAEWNRRPAPARLSRRASSFSDVSRTSGATVPLPQPEVLSGTAPHGLSQIPGACRRLPRLSAPAWRTVGRARNGSQRS